MTIKHVAVCAECDKEVPAKVTYASPLSSAGGGSLLPSTTTYAYPDGWLQLATCTAGGVTGCEYFCTYACLGKYAGRHGA